MAVRSADLSGFLAVAKHRNFRRAAQELGVTASALSHSVRALEERCGVRLFNRTTRSVSLTEAGTRLHERVLPAMLDIDVALSELDRFRGTPSGTLRLNASHLATKLALLPLCSRFLAAFPDVRLELTVNNALVDIVAQGYDAGVRLGETVAAGMIATPLGPRQRMALVASPSFFERHRPPANPYDLRALPCIGYRFAAGPLYRWEFERAGEDLAIEVGGPLVISELDLLVDAARAGVGLAYVLEERVRDEIASGQLVRVLEDWCPFFPGFYLYYPNRRQHSAAFQALLEFVRETLSANVA